MPKFLRFLFLFVLVSCSGHLKHSSRELASEEDFIHVVFDLDWTLISQIEDPKRIELNPDKYIKVGDEFYRVADWAEEVITDLVKNPRVKLSFFSGGGVERNHEVLKILKLVDGSGRSFFDVADKILSRPDLTNLIDQVGEDVRFSERYKKDVRKFTPDMEKVILVDDNNFFALDESYKRNFLWLGPTFNHYENKEELLGARQLAPTDIYIPSKPGQWKLNRNKLLVVWGVIREALEGNSSDNGFVSRIARKVVSLDLAGGENNTNIDAFLKTQTRRMNLLKKLQSGEIKDNSCAGMALSLSF
jgi:hypothetical protein